MFGFKTNFLYSLLKKRIRGNDISILFCLHCVLLFRMNLLLYCRVASLGRFTFFLLTNSYSFFKRIVREKWINIYETEPKTLFASIHFFMNLFIKELTKNIYVFFFTIKMVLHLLNFFLFFVSYNVSLTSEQTKIIVN